MSETSWEHVLGEPPSSSDKNFDTSTLLKYITSLLGILLFGFVFVLVVIATDKYHLSNKKVLERKTISKQIALQKGFTTSTIRPLSLAYHSKLNSHPDLYHAPVYPYLLGLTFEIGPISDRTVTVFGGLLWLSVLIMSFLAGYVLFGVRGAILASILLFGNVTLLEASLAGFTSPILSIGMLLISLIAFSFRGNISGKINNFLFSNRWLTGLILGAVFGGLALTHYLWCIVSIPFLYWHLNHNYHETRKELFWLVTGFLITITPWLIRNYLVTGSPFFSLYLYELVSATQKYPGNSIFRMIEPPSFHPLFFIIFYPGQILLKLLEGLNQYWVQSFTVLNPVIAILFSIFAYENWNRDEKLSFGIPVISSAILFVFLSSLFETRTLLLSAWSPLFILGSTGTILNWYQNSNANTFNDTQQKPNQSKMRLISIAGITLVILFPIFAYLFVFQSPRGITTGNTYEEFRKKVSSKATIMTNRPGQISWYGNRNALWIFNNKSGWDKFEKKIGVVNVTYIVPSELRNNSLDNRNWLYWLSSQRGVYENFYPVTLNSLKGNLRIRRNNGDS